MLDELSEIEQKISSSGISLDSSMKLLRRSAKIQKELSEALIKKSGEIKILKENIEGSYELCEFEGEQK